MLLIAAAFGHSDLVEMLFSMKLANPMDKNEDGDTALILAAKNDKVDTAVLLLRLGCEFDARNNEGFSAYQYCASVPGVFSKWVSKL